MSICEFVVLMHVHSCTFVCACLCACVYCTLIDRFEDHCGRSCPICEEVVRRDDPDGILPRRLRVDWIAAVHG